MVQKQFKHWSSKLLVAGALLAMLCGCNNQAKQQEIERQRQDSIQAAERAEKERAKQEAAERAEREAAERAERERKSFTTSLGTFDIDAVLNDCYQKGASNGSSWGNPDSRTYSPEWKSEEKFKLFWTSNFGIPNNEKAKSVFQQGYERYKQGWDDAVNF